MFLHILALLQETSMNEGLAMSRNDITPTTPKLVSQNLSIAEEETYKTLQLAQSLIRALDAESEEHMSHISAADKQGRREEADR